MTEDLETLKKQREHLMAQKLEKMQQLSEFVPNAEVDLLVKQRETLWAQKAEKERQLVELMKQETHSTPTLSKSASKKRGRGAKGESIDSEGDFAKLKLTSPYQKPNLPTMEMSGVSNSRCVVLDERQFEEIKKEHKRNRMLIREQFKEYEEFNRQTLVRVDCLQQNLNIIMDHLGIGKKRVELEINKEQNPKSENNANIDPYTTTEETMHLQDVISDTAETNKELSLSEQQQLQQELQEQQQEQLEQEQQQEQLEQEQHLEQKQELKENSKESEIIPEVNQENKEELEYIEPSGVISEKMTIDTI